MELQPPVEHGAGTTSIRFIKHDGDLALLTCGANGKIALRSLQDTGKVMRTFANKASGSSAALNCLAVHPVKAEFMTGGAEHVRVSRAYPCNLNCTYRPRDMQQAPQYLGLEQSYQQIPFRLVSAALTDAFHEPEHLYLLTSNRYRSAEVQGAAGLGLRERHAADAAHPLGVVQPQRPAAGRCRRRRHRQAHDRQNGGCLVVDLTLFCGIPSPFLYMSMLSADCAAEQIDCSS